MWWLGSVLLIGGLAVQVGAILKLLALRKQLREDEEWQKLPVVLKWGKIATLAGATAAMSFLPFAIAEADALIITGVTIGLPALLFWAQVSIAGGEGEGAN